MQLSVFAKTCLRALSVWLCLVACHLGAAAEEDPWPCQVALCLANPKGPTALKECEPPIKKAWKVWAKGKSVPDCKKKDASKMTECWKQQGKVDPSCPGPEQGGSLRHEGTYIEEQVADPEKNCPFPYIATRELTKYCAFTGVTNQYIGGRLWGRIWYGGPGGRPYIERLEEAPVPEGLLSTLLGSNIDPRAKQTLLELSQPRQPDGFEDAWAALKATIEDNAYKAAAAWKIYVDADKRAVAAEKRAADAMRVAVEADREVTHLESWAPAWLSAARETLDRAYHAYLAAEEELATAKRLAEAKDAPASAHARYADAVRALQGRRSELTTAANEANAATQVVAGLPARREKVDQLMSTATTLTAEATKLRSEADAAKREADQAELAAKPLPVYEG